MRLTSKKVIYILILIILVLVVLIATTPRIDKPHPPTAENLSVTVSEPRGGAAERARAKEPFVLTSLKETLGVIDQKFLKLDIREGDSSYTEDKRTIYLCLKDPTTGEYYSMNTLVYVTLHEIAHFLNHTNYGHTPEFNKIFNSLLCRAVSMGVYDPMAPHADWYCGVDIRGIAAPKCGFGEEHFTVDFGDELNAGDGDGAVIDLDNLPVFD